MLIPYNRSIEVREDDRMRLLIVTGMSVAGKSQVINFLEDQDWFCVDNLPPALIPKFTQLCQESGERCKNVALVVDIRGASFLVIS